jgi:BatD DUF11 like domain
MSAFSIPAQGYRSTRRISLLLAALLLLQTAFAQVTVKATSNSPVIGIEDVLQVDYRIVGGEEVEQLVPPRMTGFNMRGSYNSSSVTISNGAQQIIYNYTFLLQPTGTGTFTIGEAMVLADGKQYSSNKLTIQVVKGSVLKNRTKPPGITVVPGISQQWPQDDETYQDNILRKGENPMDKIKKNLLLNVNVNRKECYVGEAIVASYKLHSRLKSESKVIKRPSLNGFSVVDMVEQEQNNRTKENVNGRAYDTYLLRMAQLFPLQPGTLEIESVEVQNLVHFIKEENVRARNRNIWDELQRFMEDDRDNGTEDQELVLQSKPISVVVKPLPEANKPASFGGAVGKFTLDATLNTLSIPAGDAAKLLLTINGSGNLPMISAPAVNWPEGFEAFDPVAKEDISKTTVPISGSKLFEYTFNAPAKGNYIIPPIEFSYFDPATASYKIVRSDSIKITVTDARPAEENVNIPGAKPKSGNSFSWIQNIPWRTISWVAVILLLLFLGFYQWNQNRRRPVKPAPAIPDTAAVAKEKAQVVAAEESMKLPDVQSSQYWSSLELKLARQDASGFYRELEQKIWLFLEQQLSLPATELNKQTIAEKLRSRHVPPNNIEQLNTLLGECELALYTPVASESELRITLSKAKNLLKELQVQLA